MNKLITAAAVVLMAGTASLATAGRVRPGRADEPCPHNSATVADWYKQSVYDPSNSKIGEIMDVLVSPEGCQA